MCGLSMEYTPLPNDVIMFLQWLFFLNVSEFIFAKRKKSKYTLNVHSFKVRLGWKPYYQMDMD